MTAGVAHGRGINAIAEFPELALRSPETAEPEHRLLQALRIGRLQLTAVDEMADSSGDRRGPAGQRLGCARQCRGFAHKQHGYLPGGTSAELRRASHHRPLTAPRKTAPGPLRSYLPNA